MPIIEGEEDQPAPFVVAPLALALLLPYLLLDVGLGLRGWTVSASHRKVVHVPRPRAFPSSGSDRGPMMPHSPGQAHNLSFSGHNFMRGKLWTPLTAGFVHESLSHAVRHATLLLLVGGAAESVVGGLCFFAVFLLCGCGGAVIGWQLLKMRLLGNEFEDELDNEQSDDVVAVANFAESRGGG